MPCLASTLRTSSEFDPTRVSIAFFMTWTNPSRRGQVPLVGVACFDQPCDDSANVGHRLVHVGRVLAAEVHDLDRVPDDVVLTHGLEPERLHTDGAFADFRVPHEETRCERFAVDFSPAGRVDEEAAHVLLAAIQTRSAFALTATAYT